VDVVAVPQAEASSEPVSRKPPVTVLASRARALARDHRAAPLAEGVLDGVSPVEAAVPIASGGPSAPPADGSP
jgi:hypothetical protein